MKIKTKFRSRNNLVDKVINTDLEPLTKFKQLNTGDWIYWEAMALYMEVKEKEIKNTIELFRVDRFFYLDDKIMADSANALYEFEPSLFKQYVPGWKLRGISEEPVKGNDYCKSCGSRDLYWIAMAARCKQCDSIVLGGL